jgi:RecA-family ATPase
MRSPADAGHDAIASALAADPDAATGAGRTGSPIRRGRAAAPKTVRNLAITDGIAAPDLLARHFEPLRVIIDGFVVEGLTLVAGQPKSGKSWLALYWAVCVANDRPAFGSIAVDAGDVLFLGLEDSARRLRQRLVDMGQTAAATSSRLLLITKWPGLSKGCCEEIVGWLEAVPNPRLVVVDVLAKVRDDGDVESMYQADYRALTQLHAIASDYHVAILVIHHTRKTDPGDDPFNAVSGSNGLTGCADTTMILRRDFATENGARLYLRGRDLDENETAIERDAKRHSWTIVGNAAAVAAKSQREAIMLQLRASNRPMSPSEIADLTGRPNASIRKEMLRMEQRGEIRKVGRGMYVPL